MFRSTLVAFAVALLVAVPASAHVIHVHRHGSLLELEREQRAALRHYDYVAAFGSGQARAFHARWARVQRSELAETEQQLESPAVAICSVFGGYCSQAKTVAFCESRFSTTARNGQYVGLFQMGSSERATYGGGSTAIEQSQAAFRYFVATGRDWSPWTCQP